MVLLNVFVKKDKIFDMYDMSGLNIFPPTGDIYDSLIQYGADRIKDYTQHHIEEEVYRNIFVPVRDQIFVLIFGDWDV